MKQFIYKFITIDGPFMVFWVYYQFNPPQTGIDWIVSGISYVFTFASITGVFFSANYFKFKTGDD